MSRGYVLVSDWSFSDVFGGALVNSSLTGIMSVKVGILIPVIVIPIEQVAIAVVDPVFLIPEPGAAAMI